MNTKKPLFQAVPWTIGLFVVVFTVIQSIIVSIGTPRQYAIKEWVGVNTLSLSVADELLFFAAIALLMFVTLWFCFNVRLFSVASAGVFAAGALAATVLTQAVLMIGRLVYPMTNLTLSSDALVLAQVQIMGMFHTTHLLLAAMLLFFAYTARKSRSVMVAGVVAAFGQLVLSFYWLLPLAINILAVAAFVIWGTLAVVMYNRYSPTRD